MADVIIEAAASTIVHSMSVRGGVFWTSTTVGYIIYLDTNYDLVYRKTANGGATWGDAVPIAGATVGNVLKYDCYADWQTDGDAGTKIHIVYVSFDLNQIRYVYLDTSDDSVGGDDLIEACQGTGTFYTSTGFDFSLISITKTRGGNFAVALKYYDNAPIVFFSFYTSPDADTWTSKTSPYEVSVDYCLLFPANLADNQDLWGIYWDASANEISLKTFDNSNNDWTTIAEASISLNMVEINAYLQVDGVIRLSDGHLILAAWSQYDNAAADLMVWDITDAGTITAKTNVLTDSAESFLVSVFINQVNDDVYVAYTKGTLAGSLVAVFYQKSVNGGANWGGQTAMQADAEDDMRWISAGAMKAAWGGKFQPVWFNDDLDALFTNTDNGISIAAAEAGTIVTPETIALILTEYAPILKEVITPTTLGLTITLYAPVLKEVVTPSTLALVLTEYAPILKEIITPTTLTLTTTGYAPVLGEVLTPATLSLVLTEYAPILREVITPTTLSLILTEYEPSVLVSGTIIIPATLTLILATYAPDLLYCEWVYHPRRVAISRLGITRLTPSRASLSYRTRTCTYL